MMGAVRDDFPHPSSFDKLRMRRLRMRKIIG
jgi:hypothetical protein